MMYSTTFRQRSPASESLEAIANLIARAFLKVQSFGSALRVTAPTVPEATAQLLRNGGIVAEAPLEIASSTEPRIQQLERLPVSGLAPGTYELRVIVASGQQRVAESAYFTLQE